MSLQSSAFIQRSTACQRLFRLRLHWQQPQRWLHSVPRRHHIVVLDQCFPDILPLDFDYTIKYYPSTLPEQLPARIKDSTIIITSDTRVTREGILAAKHLQLVAVNGSGTDAIDKATLRRRGVALCNVPAQSTDSVAEHGIALYYGLRRRLLDMHSLTMNSRAWGFSGKTQSRLKRLGSRPRTNAEESMVVIGFGALGRRFAALGRALGMRVLIAERKDAASIRPGRTPFTQCLQEGTLFVLASPLNESSRNMIGASEFAAMDSTSLLINVGRGGIVDEWALVEALKKGHIGGAATDVYSVEPPTYENSPLLDPSIPNLLLSPHMAWYAQRTIENTQRMQKANLEGFVSGRMINAVIAPETEARPRIFDMS